MFVVYLITNQVNGKQYVGKARDARKRWWAHCTRAASGSKQAIHAAIRKYGRESFDVETLGSFKTERAAFSAEKKYIARLRTNVVGYNLTAGGEGCSGYKHTAESRKKISDVHRGVPNTDEQKRKASETLRARVFLPEWSAKISAAKMGHEVRPETREKLRAANLGKTHTADSMVKIIAANRARPRRRPKTIAEREKLSVALRGKPWSEARRAAQREKQKEA